MKAFNRLLGLASLTLACGAIALGEELLVPKDTVIPVALTQDISSATIKMGSKIKAVYTGDEDGGFPLGTVFVGTVVEATAKTQTTSGKIKITFKEAVLPNKKTIAIEGLPVNAKPTTGGKNKGKMGKGASIGAIGGTLIMGNNVAGALLGGATGAAVSASQNSKAADITFKKGTAFGIKLQASARVPQ